MPVKYLIERKQALFKMDCFIERTIRSCEKVHRREGKPPERMVLGDGTNLAASYSSFSEVRISEFQDEISSQCLFFFILIRNFHLKMILICF